MNGFTVGAMYRHINGTVATHDGDGYGTTLDGHATPMVTRENWDLMAPALKRVTGAFAPEVTTMDKFTVAFTGTYDDGSTQTVADGDGFTVSASNGTWDKSTATLTDDGTQSASLLYTGDDGTDLGSDSPYAAAPKLVGISAQFTPVAP